jgi:hypothetical protein
MNVIENFIDRLRIGDAQTFKRLTLKPVFAKTDFHLPFLTLEEALDKNLLEITELEDGASVPELLVKNTGKFDVIILEGEELRGAKQNRILNATTIVPAGGEIIIPVSCVERGRWHFVTKKFSSGMNVASPALRRVSHAAVSKNLREERSYESDQSEIWSEINRKSVRMSVESETEAASDILYSRITPDIERDLFEDLACQEKQIGFIAYIDGKFAGGDVFGSAELCEKQIKKMLRGYYLDALDHLESNDSNLSPAITAEDVLEQIPKARHEQFESIGKGCEMRFETARIQGAWKLVDENVTHLTVFPKR